jgi:hypothetical protein
MISNLYIRFDIEAIKKKFDTSAYVGVCYKTVFDKHTQLAPQLSF